MMTTGKILNARTTLTMGDVWTGNVVVRLTRSRGTVERAYGIDWEMAIPGVLDFA